MAMDKAYIDKAMVRVCQAIQSNSKIKLNNTLKAYRLNYKTISEKLVCNGQDVLTFASLSGADKNAQLIAKRLNKAVPGVVVKR